MKTGGLIILFFLAILYANWLTLVRYDYSGMRELVRIDLPVPKAELPLYGETGTLELPQSPAVLVVFGSWCTPCRKELPVLKKLSDKKDMPFIGLALRDTPEKLGRLFAKLPNPFDRIALDKTGEWAKPLRAYLVPAAYLTDGKGKVAYEIRGDITEDFYESVILPKYRELTQ